MVHSGWTPNYYQQFLEKTAVDPNVPFYAGSKRLVRGGGFSSGTSFSRAAFRPASAPPFKFLATLGFRAALPVEAVKAAIAEAPTTPAPETKATTPPAPQSIFDHERETLRWVQSLGGRANIILPNDFRSIAAADPLPNEMFHCISMRIETNISNHDMDRLVLLPNLVFLQLYSDRLSPAVWDRVAEMKSLRSLAIGMPVPNHDVGTRSPSCHGYPG